MKLGDVVDGKIKAITDYGAFVDLVGMTHYYIAVTLLIKELAILLKFLKN